MIGPHVLPGGGLHHHPTRNGISRSGGSVTCSPCAQRPSEAPLLAHRVDSLRCEGSDAIGAKRTCRERGERVDLTKMTHLRHRQPILLCHPSTAPGSTSSR